MGVLQWVLLGLNFLAVSLSVLAAITARSYLRELRRRLSARSTRSLRELDTAVASLDSSLSSITKTLRRLSSKIGMQDVRERRKGESEPMPEGLSPAERKAWLRRNLSAGKLHVIRDNPQSSEG